MNPARASNLLSGTVTTSFESATMSTDDNLPTVPVDPLLDGKPNQKFDGTSANIPAYAPIKGHNIENHQKVKSSPYGWIQKEGYFWLAPQLEYEFSQQLGIFVRPRDLST